MLNQTFSSYQLIKFCKKKDLDDNGIGKTELIPILDEVFEQIVNDSFEFKINKTKRFYFTDDLPEKLVLRKLNDNLKRIYKVEQSNRRLIIKQIVNLLEESCPFFILKTDIKHFYESIRRNRIESKLQDDSLISYHSLKLIKTLFNHQDIVVGTGIPRGLNISATLSELYMRKFDKWVKRLPGIYYYARFVDDIIIFSHNNLVIDYLKKNINKQLKLLAEGLQINSNKTNDYFSKQGILNKSFEYLGYKFSKNSNNNKKLQISIAGKKIRKIKTRIILSLMDYINNRDFLLLESRFKFLTGNYIIHHNSSGNNLKAGIYYNYLHVNDYKIFDELNTFFRKSLCAKNKSFGIKLNRILNNTNKQILLKYCFKSGFINRRFYNFDQDQMKKIISCWK